MAENQSDMKMFVSQALGDGPETISTILQMLNSPAMNLRSAMTRDFTMEDVLPALEELIQIGSLDAWYIADHDLAEMTDDAHAVLTAASTDQQPIIFRLTEKGSDELDAWLGGAPLATQEALVATPDPANLIERLKERNPAMLKGFAGQSSPLHIVVDERGAVTVGTGSVLEFRAKIRWGKGLSNEGREKIRHIVLDENGKVIGDYYGPANSDPLGSR